MKRQLGQSDLHTAPIIFGAWAIGGWYWGGTDDQAAIEAIHASLDMGINAIDTAPIYGFGRSEEVVGRALKGKRDQALIMSKCGLRWDKPDGFHFFNTRDAKGADLQVYRNLKPESIIEECERSLRRLNVDTIDLYQCHWPDPTTPIDDTMAALIRLKEQGKIRAIGVSNYTSEMMQTAQQTLTQHNLPLSSNQPRYSLLARAIEASVQPWCIQNDVGLIVYRPLEQGMLTGKMGPERTFPPLDKRGNIPFFSVANRAEVMQLLSKLHPIATKHEATLAQIVLAWTFSQPGITAAICGARSAEQALENSAAINLNLTSQELQNIGSTFQKMANCVGETR